jgi:acyl transferase domain-containing protein/NADPH:quinone reductase-like Zn-dependent oxidoreductase/SAM-dependent methyltransferase
LKTNIGHTEAASGLASLIKVVLALENDQIPPSIHYKEPNQKLALGDWNLKVASHLEQWPAVSQHQPRRASLNNFGYGGSNAHVILEGIDSRLSRPKRVANGIHAQGQNTVLVLSARDEKACQRMVFDLKAYLQDRNTTGVSGLMESLSYTLGERRTLLPWVAANIVRFCDDNLDEVIETLESPRFMPVRTPPRLPRIGMIFTGQGAQWYAMGRELLDAYPIFRASLEEAQRHLKAIGAEWLLLEELQRDAKTSKVNTTSLSIPVCVALQISLVRLLESWGITPTAVTSHSSGEIAAAYTAGALTLRQAMAAAYYRAVLAANPATGAVRDKGGMIAVGLGALEAQELMNRLSSGGKVVVGCINSPHSVTIAGDVSAVEELEELCKQDGVFARRLRVDTGYHSHHMQPIAGPYLDLLRKHIRNPPQLGDGGSVDGQEPTTVSFSSPVTGGRIQDMRYIATPEHWVSSLLKPVRFVESFTDMVFGGAANGQTRGGACNIDVLLEVGPHTALAAPVREILSLPEFDGIDLPYYGSLIRNEHAGDSMRSTAINLLRQGLPIDMHSINFPRGEPALRVLTDLPSYPWNHSNRYWQESRINQSIRARTQPPHDLLGLLIPGANIENTATWRNVLRVSESPWISDHVVQNNIVYPGAGYISLAIEAIKQLTNIQDSTWSGKSISGYRLRDVEFLAALVVPDDTNGIEVQTKLSKVSDKVIGLRGWNYFEVSSVTSDNRWMLHAKGFVRVDVAGTLAVSSAPKLVKIPLSSYCRHIDPHDLFSNLQSRGIHHGPKFQNTIKVVQDGHESRSVSYVKIADTSLANDLPRNHVLHPTTLDSIILSSYSALPGVGAFEDDAKLPYSIQKLWVCSGISCAPEHVFQCYTSVQYVSPQKMQGNSLVVDAEAPDSGAVLEMQGLVCQSVGRSGSVSDKTEKQWEEELCSKIEWAPDLSLAQPQALEEFKRQQSNSSDEVDRDLVIRLRRVCVYYCRDAIQGLTSKDIAHLQPHHVKFHRWMQNQLDLAALRHLAPDSDTWISDGPQEREREVALAATQSVEGEMACHLGPHLLSMLRGDRAPLEVMMEGRLLYRYYAEAIRMGPSLVQLAALLRQVVHKNPRARILEIGAGTGGATRHMLKALGSTESGGPLAALWHFTDVSSGFFEAARTEFAVWSEILEFDKLDIEKDPAVQGFQLGSYDIVVACEVLHATKSMARTMANVRSLMKPSATLLLMETTQGTVDKEFTFGLLPGWWLSEEPERQTSPSLTLPFLDRVLKGTGFSGIELDIPDCNRHDLYTISVIMSRASIEQHDPKHDFSHLSDDILLVVSTKEPLPGTVLDCLKATLQELTGSSTALSVKAIEDVTDSSAYSGKVCVFLGEMMQPILHNIDRACFEGIKAMATSCKGLLWVTVGGAVESRDPNSSLSHGLLRTLRNEYLGRRYYSLDLDGTVDVDLWHTNAVSTIIKVIESGFGRPEVESSTATDFEYAERDGVLLVPRLYKDTALNGMLAVPLALDWQDPDTILTREPLFQQARPLRLEVGIPGHLDTIAFADYDVEVDPPLASDMVEMEPRAYGLNFRDVMVAMGQLREHVMGLECSGVITRVGSEAQDQNFKVGDRVMALLLGPFSSRAQISWHGVAHMPDISMGFEDAASLPMVFSTAYVGLVDIARFQRGQSVLIHAAAGGVGQAAIMLSKYLGAGEMYVTVGSQEKRELIRREHGIPDEHIFSSRDESFAPGVLAATGGRGVDVVLNSLAGPLLQASFDVLATFGHLVEIGKMDLEGNSLLEMGTFARVASYTSVDMMTLLRQRGKDAHRVLSEVARLVQKREIAPVSPVTAYSMGDCSIAFRLLQTGRHMGKIVLSTKADEEVNVRPRAAPTARLRADVSYLLVGGVGGLGRSMSRWMVDHGAKNLILLSRSAGDMKKTGAYVTELREAGCRVVAISCDVSIAGQLSKALRSCEEHGLPPVRGVIQGAMVLQDSVFEQMVLEDWQTCIRPKVHSTWNLHVQWSQPGSLDFFVMLSSFSGLLGIVSQGNYAAGSVYQDAMAHWRQSRGLPGVSLDLGAVKGVGYVAENAGVADRVRRTGETLMLEERAVLQALQAAILYQRDRPQILLGLNTGPGPQWDRDGKSQMSRDARFLPLTYRESRRQTSDLEKDTGAGGSESQNLAGKLAGVKSRDAAVQLVGEAISTKLANIFMLPASEIDLTQPPALYGIDSLIAVELRNMLLLQAGAELSVFNIMQSVSLAALALDVVNKNRHLTELSA